MIVTGLDASLTSFGGARLQPGSTPELHRFRFRGKGHPRLDYLLQEVSSLVYGSSLVVVEGLAHGARSSSMLDLAGLHWLVRQLLWDEGLPYIVVSPSVRSKWLTGKGNASKEECLIAAIKRFTMVEISGNDEADALTLAAMGSARLGQPLVTMPADRAPLLSKVEEGELKTTMQILAAKK